MCMGILPIQICMLSVCLVPTELEEGLGSPGTGVLDGCKLPCGHWGSNTCPTPQKKPLETPQHQPSRS